MEEEEEEEQEEEQEQEQEVPYEVGSPSFLQLLLVLSSNHSNGSLNSSNDLYSRTTGLRVGLTLGLVGGA